MKGVASTRLAAASVRVRKRNAFGTPGRARPRQLPPRKSSRAGAASRTSWREMQARLDLYESKGAGVSPGPPAVKSAAGSFNGKKRRKTGGHAGRKRGARPSARTR